MKEATMTTGIPTTDMVVADVLDRWPETVAVFQQFKTACVGCVMAPFDSLHDVARIYGLDQDALMSALAATIAAAAGPAAEPPADGYVG
jgi:hybrid cluster-associated redox disulfide protein